MSDVWVTGLISLASAYLGGYLARGNIFQKTIWESKLNTYGAILTRLAEIERRCLSADENISHEIGWYYEHQHGRDSDFFNERMSACRDDLLKNYLLLSTEFIALFEKMQQEIESVSNDPNEDWDDIYYNFSRQIRTYRPLLLAQAKAEVLNAQENRFIRMLRLLFETKIRPCLKEFTK